MKKIMLLSLCFVIDTHITFAQNWQWKNSTPDSKILKDANDNLYVFSNGSLNFTVEKLDTNGTTIWTKTATGNAAITAYKIDGDNNLVLLGNITSSTTIDAFTLIPKGQQSFFILKLSPNSSVLSANVYGSPNKTFANDLFINANGDYLVGGGFTGTFDINGYSIAGDTLQNLFIVKTDSNQSVLWSEKSTWINPGGDAWVNEVVETSSGKIYATIIVSGGVIDFKGYQFSSYGFNIIQLNNSRNITWTDKSDYYSQLTDIQTSGDTVYMKEFMQAPHFSTSSILMWNDSGLKTSKSFNISALGYEVANRKIYYAFIAMSGDPNYGSTFLYRKIGSLTLGLSDQGQASDSIVTTNGSYSEVQYINTTSLYLGGQGEGMNTPFVGKISISKFPFVVANFKITTPPCEKSNVVFENTSRFDTAAYWEFTGGIPATSTKLSDTVRFNTPGVHSVKLISSNGISSDTIMKNIFINPQPAMPVISQISNTLISNYSSGNLWYYGNDSIRLATDSIYQITLEGNYEVRYTDTNGCYNISAPFNATFNGISEIVSPVTNAWVKTISGAQYDRGVDIIQTYDKGFLVCALTNSFPVTQYNTILIKYDSLSNREWSKIVGPGLVAVQIKQTPDSGYVLLGNNHGSLAIIKLNKSGDVVFFRTYKNPDWGVYAVSFSFTSDGGYIINANYNSASGNPFYSGYLLKIDGLGLTQWSKIISPQGYTSGGTVYQTPDGGYIFNGYGSFPCCTSQNYICKLDQYGTIEWINEYQNLGYILESSTMVIANDNGYVMAGSTVVGTSGGNDAYVMKVSLTGTVEWCKVYGTVYEEKALSIKPTGDGYIVLGRTEGFKSGTDLYLFKIDNNGNHLWSHAYGTEGEDEGVSITKTNDHGFAITGAFGANYSSTKGDIYFIKTDSLGNTGCRSTIVWTQVKDMVPIVQNYSPPIYSGVFPDTLNYFSATQNIPDSIICDDNVISIAVKEKPENISGITIFPNPSTGTFTIDSKLALGEIKIYNMLGETVYSKNYKNGNKEFRKNLDLSKETKGIYFVEIEYEGKRINKKVIMD